MINWASLVHDLPLENVNQCPKTHHVPTSSGNKLEAVGTFSSPYANVYKDIFKDVPTVPAVPTVFERARECEDEKHNPSSFLEPVGGGVQGQSAPHKTTLEPACRTCAHFRRPGLSDGYCCERDDLPPPTPPGILCAGSPTMAGRAAPPGGCIPTCDPRTRQGRHRGEGGGG